MTVATLGVSDRTIQAGDHNFPPRMRRMTPYTMTARTTDIRARPTASACRPSSSRRYATPMRPNTACTAMAKKPMAATRRCTRWSEAVSAARRSSVRSLVPLVPFSASYGLFEGLWVCFFPISDYRAALLVPLPKNPLSVAVCGPFVIPRIPTPTAPLGMVDGREVHRHHGALGQPTECRHERDFYNVRLDFSTPRCPYSPGTSASRCEPSSRT